MTPKASAAAVVLVCFGATSAGAQTTQTVQFKDLEGSMIEAEFVYSRTFRVQDRVRSNELLSQFNLAIGPGDALKQTVASTIIAPNGREKNTNSSADFILGKPRRAANGPVVWRFENGTLTRLQSLLSGARRISFVLKREGGKLTCTVDAAFAREEGMGEIETKSTSRPGATVQWLDIKQKSATCRVVQP